jgi:hypothetical protein
MGFREQGSGMMAETTSRVPKHTPEHLNRKIIDKTINNILTHGISGPQIESRLKALDREWDIERLLQANASSLVVIGVLLGVFANHWFYLVPFLVGIFLLQHSIQGWCPPIRLFRRLGFRTCAEIAAEHYALRFLRGDFNNLTAPPKDDLEARADKAFRPFRW